MKKFLSNMYLIYSIIVVITFIIEAFFKPETGLLFSELILTVSCVLTVRLFYKTTLKNDYVPIYKEKEKRVEEVYDDYIFSEYLNAKICKASNKRYLLISIMLSYFLSLLFFIMKLSPIYLILYVIYIIFGFLLSFFWMKAEKYANLSFKKPKETSYRLKMAKYATYFTLIGMIGIVVIQVVFISIIQENTEYFTEDEVIEMIADTEERFGHGEKYNYLFHTEECDIIGKNCEIMLWGYFDSKDYGVSSVYIRDENGTLNFKVVTSSHSKQSFIDQANKGTNKKFDIQ